MPKQPSEPPQTIGGWPTDINPGELKAIHREEHLCNQCLHQGLCVVDHALQDEMFTVISRCGAHIPLPEDT